MIKVKQKFLSLHYEISFSILRERLRGYSIVLACCQQNSSLGIYVTFDSTRILHYPRFRLQILTRIQMEIKNVA